MELTLQTPSAKWYFDQIVVKMIKDGKSHSLIKNTLLEKFRDEFQDTVAFRTASPKYGLAVSFWSIPETPETRRILTNVASNIDKKWRKLWAMSMRFYESRGIIGPDDLTEFLSKSAPESREKHA